MANMKKIGRNNNKRGKEFEKAVAKTLQWNWVGSVRHSMTPGDVMDAFLNGGYWIGECKTQTQGPANTISVNKKWIEHIEKDGEMTSRTPVIFVTTKGHPDKFALVNEKFWTVHVNRVLTNDILFFEDYYEWSTKARGSGRGFAMLRKHLNQVKHHGMGVVTVHDAKVGNDSIDEIWYVFHLEFFSSTLDLYNLDVISDGTEHQP